MLEAESEEHAERLGVKLVFPLVAGCFPALSIVILGPVVIRSFVVNTNVCIPSGENSMNTMNLVMLATLAVLVVVYMARRRSRQSQED